MGAGWHRDSAHGSAVYADDLERYGQYRRRRSEAGRGRDAGYRGRSDMLVLHFGERLVRGAGSGSEGRFRRSTGSVAIWDRRPQHSAQRRLEADRSDADETVPDYRDEATGVPG